MICYLSLLFIFINLCNHQFTHINAQNISINNNSSRYNLITYVNATIRLIESLDTVGLKLITDPLDHNKNRYFGYTINKQTFIKQFIIDISKSLNISINRIKVINILRGNIHFTWEARSILVNFLLLESSSVNNTTTVGLPFTSEPSLVQVISLLTNQIQDPLSYIRTHGNVTVDIDPLYGIQISNWDSSIRLTYAINIVGDNHAVTDGVFINLGSLGICDNSTQAVLYPQYCEFERFFEDDLARACNISIDRIQILFIKYAAVNAVLVHFRINPPLFGMTNYSYSNNSSKNSSNTNSSNTTKSNTTSTSTNSNTTTTAISVTDVMTSLAEMIRNTSSMLYMGNVTIRTDPAWGLGGVYPTQRKSAPIYAYKYYEYTADRLVRLERGRRNSAHERCKASRKCNWGITGNIHILCIYI